MRFIHIDIIQSECSHSCFDFEMYVYIINIHYLNIKILRVEAVEPPDDPEDGNWCFHC